MRDRRIAHFTHVSNLPAIVAGGSLKADSVLREEAVDITECGDTEIKRRRRGVPVSSAPGGYVGDYVPFYFAPRSPMLFSISRGNVSTYHEGQDPLVYLWTHLSTVDAMGLAWVGSDGNCAHTLTAVTNDWTELESVVDWDIMTATWWRDTEDDGDRKRRRMAEFLVHQRCPLTAIEGFTARTDDTAEQVRRHTGGQFQVDVMPQWYY